ncbi:MAG: hypothetical protein WC797_00255 [Candidatus Paceibacterota bacterium]|jgi:hypothetical protein
MSRVQESTTILACPIYGCGEGVEVDTADLNDGSWKFSACPHCHTPWWPQELGFTGNDPESCQEFARTHDVDGNELLKPSGVPQAQTRVVTCRDCHGSFEVSIEELHPDFVGNCPRCGVSQYRPDGK